MSAAGEFIDATLQYEGSWQRAEADSARLGGGLEFYGASVGAVRGTVRDAGRRYAALGHDEITALCSELWAVPVFERRLAAIVLLQAHVPELLATDLTRIEGFLRQSALNALIDPLAIDVVAPMISRLDGAARARTSVVIQRWATEQSPGLRRAAGLVRRAIGRS
jgi:hypothetical protein